MEIDDKTTLNYYLTHFDRSDLLWGVRFGASSYQEETMKQVLISIAPALAVWVYFLMRHISRPNKDSRK